MKTNLSPGLNQRHAFTLVEMLVVMGVIAVLAAMLFPAAAIMKRNAAIKRATTELKRVSTMIDAYKGNLNHYPPDNPDNVAVHQLFYELAGTTNLSSGIYVTEDARGITNMTTFFGNKVSGFVNVSRGSGDEAQRARPHLIGLKPNQYLEVVNNTGVGTVLGLTDKGPLMLNEPPPGARSINPWRYVSTGPTNNPGNYDLWIDLSLGGKTLRISNWRERPEEVTP